MTSRPYFAVLHYDGAEFAGWQRQASDRTVQGEFEAGLATLTGTTCTAHAAGRTDSGVHATGQTVSFEAADRWEPAVLQRALNANTPPDIWVAKVGIAPAGFHARKHATARRYEYVVGCDEGAKSPFRRPYEWDLARPLDPDALAAGAALFRGAHDFRAFSAVGQEKPHYRCSISIAEWRERPRQEGFIFTVESDRFLHRMVRFIVGSMVDVARGRRSLADVSRLLGTTDNRETSPPAPPQGLYFVAARYPQLDLGIANEILPRHGAHR